MSEQTVPLTNEQAQTEANIIKNFEKTGYPDLIIDKKVKPEFKDKMKGTAKIDLAHQMHEQFKEKYPEILRAMVDKDTAVVNITRHLASKDKNFTNENDTEMEKHWEMQTRVAKQLVSNVLLGMSEIKGSEQTHTESGFILTSFAMAIDSMVKEHDLFGSDRKIFGDLLTAVMAELEITTQNKINGSQNIEANVDKAYERQQRFNTEFEKNKNKTVPPQPLS